MGKIIGDIGASGSGHVAIGVLEGRGEDSVQINPTGLEIFPKARILAHLVWGEVRYEFKKQGFWDEGTIPVKQQFRAPRQGWLRYQVTSVCQRDQTSY